MATFELYEDRSGNFRWRFKASNGRIMADSAEGYVNKSDCRAGIDFVKAHAAGATVDDQTQARAAFKYG